MGQLLHIEWTLLNVLKERVLVADRFETASTLTIWIPVQPISAAES